MADNVAQKAILKLADNMGKVGSLSLWVPTDVSTDPLSIIATGITALNALTNCIVVGQVSETANDVAVGSATSQAYDIRDKLDVEYVGSQNDHHTVHIGDVDASIFATGSELPDPTNTAWLALKSAINTNVKDKLGNAVTVIRGYRQRSRNLKSSQRFI